MRRPVIVNGRFLAAPRTGVQRAAACLVEALDAALAAEAASAGADAADPGWTLAHPAWVSPPALSAIRQRALAGPRGALWEQTALALAARGAVLANFANAAPLLSSGGLLLIHDAQAFDAPASYSRAFRLWYGLMQPIAARRAATVATVSRHSAGRLAAHGVAREGAILIAPNGVDHVLRTPPDHGPIGRAPPGFLAFASTQPHKNLGLLLRLFAEPALADLSLALIGDQPPGIVAPPNARFLGRLDDAGLRGAYERATAFLFPSLTEGFGLPPGEAMACGCPVIASPRGALAELYDGAAVLVDPDDAQGWARALRRMADDPAHRAAVAARGAARARDMTWAASAAPLRAAIEAARG